MSNIGVDLAVYSSTRPNVTDRLHNSALARKHASPSLFAGVEAGASEVLGISSIRHRSALTEICSRRTIVPGIVARIFHVISHNCNRAEATGVGSLSRQNWRWCRPQTGIATHNTSPEVKLERAIAAACASDWANQVPICSGAAGPSADRRRAIDLVHKAGDKHFQFIELKIASDTPLYAAIEIIGYGCVWLLSRQQPSARTSELLQAEQVDLLVLAPERYYGDFRLGALAAALDAQVADLGRSFKLGLSFRFEVLPEPLTERSPPPASVIMPLLGLRRTL